MKAMVVGGIRSQMTGAWARTMKETFGIEVAHAYVVDEEFRGFPSRDVPAGTELVLVVAGIVNHRVSSKAAKMAKRAGVRCETVSKDAVRTVEWLEKRGYKRVSGGDAPQEAVVVDTRETWRQAKSPEQKELEDLKGLPEAPRVGEAPAQEPEWLDISQVSALLPDLPRSMFYAAAGRVVKRPVRKEDRGSRSGPQMVWTMEEVLEIERDARERDATRTRRKRVPVYTLDEVAPQASPATSDQVWGIWPSAPDVESAPTCWPVPLHVTLRDIADSVRLLEEAQEAVSEWRRRALDAEGRLQRVLDLLAKP